MIETITQDLKYAVRSLRRTPGFAAAAIITLALGIGANSAIFTLLDAVMFKPLNVPAPQELVALYEQPREGSPDASGGTGRYTRFSYPRFARLRDALGTRGSLAAMTRTTSLVVRFPGGTQAETVRAQLVSAEYFATLDVRVTQGRVIGTSDVRPVSPAPVAVIGDRLWRDRLGSANVLGQTLLVSGIPTTIIGIAPPGFIGVWSDARAELWLPLTMQQGLQYRNNASSYGEVNVDQPWMTQDRMAWLNIIGRIPSVDVGQARAALEIANRAAVQDMAPAIDDSRVRSEILSNALVVQSFTRGFSRMRAQLSQPFIALTVMVAVVLLIACANVANLLLARSAGRAREIAIRIAVGASRTRLLQQGLVESTLLAGLGGAAGWLAGLWSSGLLASAFLATSRDRLPEVYTPDNRVFMFTAGVSLATALLCGLLPALRAARGDEAATLVRTSRTSLAMPSILRGMRPLVAAQVALAVVVVFSAALLGRSLLNFAKVDPGFDAEHLVSVSFNPAASGYRPDQIAALNSRLVTAVNSTGGVVSAAVSTCGLLADCSYSGVYALDGRTDDDIDLNENYVGPGYFSTVGIPVTAGREFDDRDRDGGALVAVVSQSIADRYFPGGDPIGHRIGDREFTAEIVGVVGDVRPYMLRDAPVAMVYFPIRQWPSQSHNLAARVSGDVNQAVSSVSAALRRAEPGLVLDNVGTMALQIERNVLRERLVTYLAAVFGALSLLLGCVGLYGVLSYSVARRTQEFGVRLALGARPRDLTRDVFRDALMLTAAGTAVGLIASLWAAGLLQTLLFEVSTLDPVVALASCTVLLVATLTASYLPARRAARVDPIAALKND